MCGKRFWGDGEVGVSEICETIGKEQEDATVASDISKKIIVAIKSMNFRM